MRNTNWGVAVARFQTAELHIGHRFLLDAIGRRHEKMLVVLGTGRALPGPREPLDFETRKAMVLAAYPQAIVREIRNERDDKRWSAKLDETITEVAGETGAVLYGSRDCFKPYYNGQFEVVELDPVPECSGTREREKVAAQVRDNVDFRRGIIYREMNRLPLTYPTVDVAILNPEERRVLLGRRDGDGGKYRFIGGFVDPKDKNLETTVYREVREEAGDFELGNIVYLGSTKVDDWRYRDTNDGIMTTFFAATRIFGPTKAGDDIDEVKWFNWTNFENHLVPEHAALGQILTRHLDTNYQTKKKE